MNSDLLPCPFCGGEGEMSWFAKGDSPALAGYFVECTSCSASGEPFDIQGEMPDRDEYTRQKAITAWNTRTKADQIMGLEETALAASQAEVERLTRERDEARELARSRGVTVLKLTEDGGAHLCRAEAAEARATRAEGLLAEAGEVLGRLYAAIGGVRHGASEALIEAQCAARAFLAKLKDQG